MSETKVLRWDDLLEAELPNGWSVSDPDGDVIEIVPPEPEGAAHITLLRRFLTGPPEDGEARELVRSFERKHAWTPTTELVERREAESLVASRRAFDGKFWWEIGAKVWRHRAAMFSFVHDGESSEQIGEALSIFDSLRALS